MWKQYTKARDEMFLRTSHVHAPWRVVQANDKKEARLAVIHDLLASFDYPARKKGVADRDHALVFPGRRNRPRTTGWRSNGGICRAEVQGFMTDPRAIIRNGPMTMFQIVVIAICTALNMIDGFDVLSMPFTAPAIAKQWGVEPAALGVLLSAGLAGMSIGSLCLSPLADLIGRRAVVNLATLIVSIGMLAASAAQGIWDLAAGRASSPGLASASCCRPAIRCWPNMPPARWRNLSISAMVVGYIPAV